MVLAVAVEGVTELGWAEMVGRLLLAALLGGLLGLEREFDGQDAGFRTHLLVVLGSALFGVLSVGGFDAFTAGRNDTNVTVDVTRIAAYVAPGIGFIGGGAILKYGGKVSGITTAASLWTGAAVGVAAGLGAWESAVAATLLTLVALQVLQPVGRVVERFGRNRHSVLVVRTDPGVDLGEIVELVVTAGGGDLRELRYGVGPQDEGQLTVAFWRRPDSVGLARTAERLASLPAVRDVAVSSER